MEEIVLFVPNSQWYLDHILEHIIPRTSFNGGDGGCCVLLSVASETLLEKRASLVS